MCAFLTWATAAEPPAVRLSRSFNVTKAYNALLLETQHAAEYRKDFAWGSVWFRWKNVRFWKLLNLCATQNCQLKGRLVWEVLERQHFQMELFCVFFLFCFVLEFFVTPPAAAAGMGRWLVGQQLPGSKSVGELILICCKGKCQEKKYLRNW